MFRTFVGALSLCGVLTACGRANGPNNQPAGTLQADVRASSRAPLQPIMDVELNGSNCAWIVNKDLDLVFTTDAGASWQQTDSGVVGGYMHVRFVDPHWGWARNSRHLLWFTSDGGHTWSRLGDIAEFIRLCTGDPQNPPGPLWLSNDAGSTWLNDPRLPESPSDDTLEIKLTDQRHVWVAQTLTVLQSEDSGTHWLRHEFNGYLLRFFELDSNTAWVAVGEWTADGDYTKTLYQTKDGGRTWRKKRMRLPAGDSNELYFINDRQGWFSTTDKLYRTDSGGSSWYVQEIPGNNTIVDSIYFRDQNEGWAAGEEEAGESDGEPLFRGVLLHSLDGGATWQLVRIEEDDWYDRVQFGDDGEGWLVGFDRVYHSSDGGLNWQAVLRLPSAYKK